MVDDWSAPFGVSDARSREKNKRLVEEELGKCIVRSEEHLHRFRAIALLRARVFCVALRTSRTFTVRLRLFELNGVGTVENEREVL